MEGLPEERCTILVGELVQALEMVRQLDGHMLGSGQMAGGGDEQCRALVATMRASIDRSVHIAKSFYAEADGRLPVFGGLQPAESPPSGGGDGSPLSAGSDQAGDYRGRGNAAGQCNKKRKLLPKWKTQVRVSAVQDVTPLDDGLSWRKYGQKDILSAKYPRAYFRCTYRHTRGCHVSKQVQRTDGDPLLFDVVYHGNHTCSQAQAAAAHLSNEATPPAASAENSPVFESTVLQPFSPPSNNNNGCETSKGFPADSMAASTTFMPTAAAQATSESQMVSSSSSYTVGVPNVPEVGLASTTNSPMGDMVDFMFPLDDAADFLENTDYF